MVMNQGVLVAIIAAVPGTISGTIAAIVSVHNRSAIANVKVEIDGRMGELLNLTRTAAHAAGMKEERDSHDTT
jgi:uncharacterized membrane protein